MPRIDVLSPATIVRISLGGWSNSLSAELRKPVLADAYSMIYVLGVVALRLFSGGCCDGYVQRDPGCRAEEMPKIADVNSPVHILACTSDVNSSLLLAVCNALRHDHSTHCNTA